LRALCGDGLCPELQALFDPLAVERQRHFISSWTFICGNDVAAWRRQAQHIEEGYEHRGIPEKEAERRAWATVNKETHGGKKSGSGRGTEEDHSPSRKGGRLGSTAAARRPAAECSRSAKKAVQTRKRCAA
jgi:hypothetical protein